MSDNTLTPSEANTLDEPTEDFDEGDVKAVIDDHFARNPFAHLGLGLASKE